MVTFRKKNRPYVSPFDPCPPILVKTFVTPPNLYVPYQAVNLPQFPPKEALYRGTLWQAFCDPYFSPFEKPRGEDQ